VNAPRALVTRQLDEFVLAIGCRRENLDGEGRIGEDTLVARLRQHAGNGKVGFVSLAALQAFDGDTGRCSAGVPLEQLRTRTPPISREVLVGAARGRHRHDTAIGKFVASLVVYIEPKKLGDSIAGELSERFHACRTIVWRIRIAPNRVVIPA
jgi:hypothetical protein